MEIELKPESVWMISKETVIGSFRIRAVFVLEWMRCCSPDLQK